MSPTTLATNAAPTDIPFSQGFFKLSLELRDMVYDDLQLQLQQEVKETQKQLTIRYRPSYTPYYQISNELIGELNKRKPLDHTPKFEVTQRNLIFISAHQDMVLYPEQGIPYLSDVPLILNFNINDNNRSDDFRRKERHELLDWIAKAVGGWHSRRRDAVSANTTSKIEDAPVTIRFWFCKIEAYDKFRLELDNLWELTFQSGMEGTHTSGGGEGDIFVEMMDTRAKIETIYYERYDHVAFPNARAIARSIVLETYHASGIWEADVSVRLGDSEYPSLTVARAFSQGTVYNEAGLEDYAWWNLKGLDEYEEESYEE